MSLRKGGMNVAKNPKGQEPEWLDEDPDEVAASQKNLNDPYGSMTDAAKFHRAKDPKAPDTAPKKAAVRGSLAQFCGQWGMRFEGDTAILDLHGLRLSSALEAVDRAVNAILDDGRVKKLRIITGRGNHSEERVGILAKEVHPHVEQTYAKFIADINVSPADLVVRGFPARGHFDVRFK